jgi:hypothetical protein
MAGRHPLLLIIPAAVDLGLWLGPKLSISTLLKQWSVIWEAFFKSFYTPSQAEAMKEITDLVRGMFDQIGRQVNLATSLTSGWLTAPSAVTDIQATRFKLISDGVLAPVGVSLSLPAMAAPPSGGGFALDIGNLWVALLVVVALWLLGQFLTAVYLWLAARAFLHESSERGKPVVKGSALVLRQGGPQSPVAPHLSEGETGPAMHPPVTATGLAAAGALDVFPPLVKAPDVAAGGAEFPTLLGRLLLLNVLLGIAMYLIRLPLGLAGALAVVTGSGLGSALFVLSGGLTLWFTLWFLSSMFFVSESMDRTLAGPGIGPCEQLAHVGAGRRDQPDRPGISCGVGLNRADSRGRAAGDRG